MTEEIKIEQVPLKPWKDGEIELFANGLIKHRTMTRAEVEKQFPKALEKGK